MIKQYIFFGNLTLQHECLRTLLKGNLSNHSIIWLLGTIFLAKILIVNLNLRNEMSTLRLEIQVNLIYKNNFLMYLYFVFIGRLQKLKQTERCNSHAHGNWWQHCPDWESTHGNWWQHCPDWESTHGNWWLHSPDWESTHGNWWQHCPNSWNWQHAFNT